MLVMPYTPNRDDDGKMQELYTKAPVTQIINDSLRSGNSKPTSRGKTQAKQTGNAPNEPNITYTATIKSNPGEKTSSNIYLTLNKTSTLPNYTSLTTNIQKGNHRQVTAATVKHILHELTTERIKYRRGSTTQRPISSTETSTNFIKRRRPVQSPRHPNHKYPEESQPIAYAPNSFPPLNLSHFTTQKPVRFTHQTVPEAKLHHFTTPKPALLDINLPDDLKSTLHELNIDDSFKKNPLKYDFFNLPNSNDRLEENYGVVDTYSPDPPVVPDISNVANTLTPEMKELLINFGLLGDGNHPLPVAKEEPYIGIPTAEVRPDSYIRFKPLPDISGANEEMEEFLGRFGLGRSAKDKRIHNPQDTLSESPNVDFEIVPDTLKGTVKNLGLWNREGKDFEPRDVSPQKSGKKHVFNPKETTYASQEEIDKLNQLMDLIKQLEKLNGTATEEDLNKLDMKHLKELIGSVQNSESGLSGESDYALNPINDYDIGLTKNEVKRQENSTGTSTEATTTVNTTEETQTVDIKGLEDSFGGAGAVSEPEATLPPPTEAPKTGFYYLLDWNSFFDIDDQKGKRVNLRFQPKVGDPRQFISVSVP
ncbi:hypothetical protein RI129_007568 [Pyrocoelia pectoralis]|uniref:Uncharacterized protein n=1 Tax=Pyrocoelia pectoralis TaxID=417401 RepID=A0AAN7VBE1_9COLE